MKRYAKLARTISESIRRGDLAPGTRIPTVRAACRAYGVSPSTVFRAYYALEGEGLIVARARSGYFVANLEDRRVRFGHEPPRKPAAPPAGNGDTLFRLLDSLRCEDVIPLGSAFASYSLFPMSSLWRAMASAARNMDRTALLAGAPPGHDGLRRQIALRYLNAGAALPMDEIIITTGALEALTLSLQALTRPGDIVAIERPAFHAALEAVQRLHLKAVEIPVDPRTGLDLDALEKALDTHPVRACWFMTSFHNPTGATLTDERKHALIDLLAARDVPLIEDDVYGELHFGTAPTRPAKLYDDSGLVLHCGSFSKCLAPGFRIGWVAAGRYVRQIRQAKGASAPAADVPAQMAISSYLRDGAYDRFLRKLRRNLAAHQAQMLAAVRAYFPAGTEVFAPRGGYFLWIELPPRVDALHLFGDAMDSGVSIAPGPIFSATGGFRRYLRLNYGRPWTPAVEHAMETIGTLAARQRQDG
ncbi:MULTISPECIES: PLP-dependent aminotransferase family protein [unclassified Burkholderia]|uniref:aminotransferase-like domain-containing protein n=1 Tax=unclassified Burkholderia TaxID=2613784 RepID=UPI001420A715|nr:MULTISPECIES: PLP-dependent aminotransferase family protein [unclassified Burkholderia]NIE55674.1 PLP-dependent aminotransferase family protein [Burkholderia sp. Ap-955]NIF11682.1 PLP-dependent aminotransferase family protein [Burkholderia sp. Ax-1735]NIG05129.1 PLP-dependent aminotransferase family protein [Burkholderia sp. Tr-849]